MLNPMLKIGRLRKTKLEMIWFTFKATLTSQPATLCIMLQLTQILPIWSELSGTKLSKALEKIKFFKRNKKRS